jgi:GNAT superfamily N-acetyltransferase
MSNELGGALVRPALTADAEEIAALHVTAWRETYRGILPDAMVDGLTMEEALASWQAALAPASDQSAFVGGDVNGRLVGIASGCRSNEPSAPGAGVLDKLYIVKAGQGLGLGRRLLAAVAEALHAQGHPEMIVVVHADNPAAYFYAAMGGREAARRERLHRGHPCPELLFTWPLPLPLQERSAS